MCKVLAMRAGFRETLPSRRLVYANCGSYGLWHRGSCAKVYDGTTQWLRGGVCGVEESGVQTSMFSFPYALAFRWAI